MHTAYVGTRFRIQEARPSRVIYTEGDSAAVWGLGVMVFLALIFGIVWPLSQGFPPGLDFLALFCGAFIALAAILMYAVRNAGRQGGGW
jgi:cytochrome b subunit of formate dehydrogenase